MFYSRDGNGCKLWAERIAKLYHQQTIILGKHISLHTLPTLILHFISELMQPFGRDLFRHTSFAFSSYILLKARSTLVGVVSRLWTCCIAKRALLIDSTGLYSPSQQIFAKMGGTRGMFYRKGHEFAVSSCCLRKLQTWNLLCMIHSSYIVQWSRLHVSSSYSSTLGVRVHSDQHHARAVTGTTPLIFCK